MAHGPGALEPVFPPATFGVEPVRKIKAAPADAEDEWTKEQASPIFVAQALPPWLRVRHSSFESSLTSQKARGDEAHVVAPALLPSTRQHHSFAEPDSSVCVHG